MKAVREISRILIGIVFIFSGFVKGIDLLGSTYKFTDYFNAFGTEWATTFSFALAIILSFAEFAIGAAIFLNYKVKIFSWLLIAFMAFFLPFTLYIAIANPVSDCGCFGDALVITNWQTFYKNIIISALAIIVFIFRKKYENRMCAVAQHVCFGLFALIFAGFSFYSYNHLPIFDFRPYKVGVNIFESMQIPQDAPSDIYENEFIYREKSSGNEKKFSEDNYPWQDTLNWEYVSMESKLIQKGYEAPIHDFTIETMEGEDVADYFLQTEGYTFIIVAYNLNKSNKTAQEKINQLASEALSKGMNVICLTSSIEEEIEEFKERYNPEYEFFFCDEITLKTIVRANPGILLTREGTIIDKWHWRDTPSLSDLNLE